MATRDELEQRFVQLQKQSSQFQKQLEELRLAVLGDQKPQPDDGGRRFLTVLGEFYDAPRQRLLRSEALAAGTRAGYPHQGMGGLYRTGSAFLKADGDWRMLTDLGRDTYEKALEAGWKRAPSG